MLAFAVLGLLYEAPMHGYELRKQLGVRLGGFRAFSYGSLYPALRRLLRAGLIVEETEPSSQTSGAWSRRSRRRMRRLRLRKFRNRRAGRRSSPACCSCWLVESSGWS